MKHTLFRSFLLLSVCLLVLASCSKSRKEKQLVGKYRMEAVFNDDEYNLFHGTITGSNEYKDGGQLTTDWVYAYVFPYEEDGYSNEFVIRYEVKGSGTWQINGDILQQNISNVEVNFLDHKAQIDDARSVGLLQELTENLDESLSELKKSLEQTFAERIVSLDDKQLVSVDGEGNKSVFPRIR